MLKKKKYLLVIIILLVTFLSIIIVNAQEVSIEISKTPPVVTSPLKITPAPPYYYGDIINAEFSIANRNLFPITFNILTVGGRDPDDQVADFTHKRNITIGPFESYNYKGTLALKKVGNFHFFCTYQTSDNNWNTNVDLGYGLTAGDRIKDIIVKVKEGQYIVPEISDKINIEWEKTFGGYGHDMAHSIVQTEDQGYIITGFKGGRSPGDNVWVFKLDERGGFVWDKIFGGKKDEYAYSIVQTGDRGSAVLASRKKKGTNVLLAKIDERSNVKWDKVRGVLSRGYHYGESEADFITKTKDGGYIIFHGTQVVHEYNAPIDNIFRSRLELATKPHTKINSIIQTKDEGYAGAGRAGRDIWVFKLDERARVEWDKTYGDSRNESFNEEEAYSIIQTKDGGYAIAGRRRRDIWVFKLDERGRVEWDKILTRSNRKEWNIQWDRATSIIQTKDGGYIISGYIDVSKTTDRVDSSATWVFKLDERGKVEWNKIFGEENDGCLTQAYSIIQAKDGGYVLAGRTNAISPSAGGDDIWVIKLKEQ